MVFIEHDAAKFVETARYNQKEGGKPLRGASFLSTDTLVAIKHTARELLQDNSDKVITEEQAIYMMERFEEMCRRQGQTLDSDLRKDVLKLLSSELTINLGALKLPAHKLIPVTIYHGAIGPDLFREFPALKETPGIIHYAVYKHPTAPRQFLQDVEANITLLERDAELAPFRSSDWVFKYAAVNSPNEPKRFLQDTQKRIAQLQEDPEFFDLKHDHGLMIRAVIGHPKKPKEFLRRARESAARKGSAPSA